MSLRLRDTQARQAGQVSASATAPPPRARRGCRVPRAPGRAAERRRPEPRTQSRCLRLICPGTTAALEQFPSSRLRALLLWTLTRLGIQAAWIPPEAAGPPLAASGGRVAGIWMTGRRRSSSSAHSRSGTGPRRFWSIEQIGACSLIDGPGKVNEMLRLVQVPFCLRPSCELWSEILTSLQPKDHFQVPEDSEDRYPSEGMQASGFFFRQALNI